MHERLIYLDTNIYMDYFDGRTDLLRPLGEFAYQVLKRTISCEFKIIISGLVLEELFYNTYEENIKKILPDFAKNNKIVEIEASPEDIARARHIVKERKTNFNDTLHAVLAKKANADFLVTRNLKDFYELQDLAKWHFLRIYRFARLNNSFCLPSLFTKFSAICSLISLVNGFLALPLVLPKFLQRLNSAWSLLLS